MKNILVSDFTVKEMPHGGSEWVNQVIIEEFNLDFEYSNKINQFNKDNLYIISNISLMSNEVMNQIVDYNYIILEHDYKICASRHPWRYPNSLIPKSDRINYELYKKAKAVFVQTTDHLNVYLKNDVKGNFINLNSSIWSNKDLDLLSGFINKEKSNKTAIYATNNWIKNTNGAIDYCVKNNVQYGLVPNQDRDSFLNDLSNYSSLTFFPIARETFCRLVIEAKCMGMDVVTTRNYGASLENYFDLKGEELITFLRMSTKNNLKKIKKYLNGNTNNPI